MAEDVAPAPGDVASALGCVALAPEYSPLGRGNGAFASGDAVLGDLALGDLSFLELAVASIGSPSLGTTMVGLTLGPAVSALGTEDVEGIGTDLGVWVPAPSPSL